MSIRITVASLLACISAYSFAEEKTSASLEGRIEPFFKEHCLRCHGDEKQKGDFRIDTLSRDFQSGADTELWFEVITRMGAGEMPPDDEEVLPGPEESEFVVEWLTDRIRDGEAARLAKRAPVAHYRLSREEYSHTVYDLLGVRYDTRAPGAFSEDPEWHGFERLGSELSLSPSHVEKYLHAAKVVLDRAFPDVEPVPLKSHRTALDIDWHNREKKKELDEIGVTGHVRTLIWPGHKLSYLRPSGGHNHSPGLYRARIQVSGLTPDGGRPPHMTLYSKALDRMIFETDVLAPEDEPVIFEFETYIPDGPVDISINNEVPGPSNAGRSGRPGGFVFTTLDDPKSRAPWQRKMTDDEGNPLYPFLIFDWIEWEGPIVKEGDAKKREGLFPEDSDPAKVLQILRKFAERAWRRPVSDAELNRYLKIVNTQLAGGAEFRTAYKSGMLGVMASKNFTYLVEGTAGENRQTLTDYELASRLSYFLWSSMPDEELVAAAEAGTLSDPEVLQAQVGRMIADPKIDRFTESFPHQWLQLKKVGMFPPDEKLYPEYDKWLEKSMVLETQKYFAEVFHKDGLIVELIDSDWTIVNPRLADHYGLPAPERSGFERVSLPEGANRGGILTHGSILSLTSDGTRHRPVHRGIWVSEAILGKTPPPPPPNVDAIEPNPIDEPKATIRQKLAAHIADPNCASCHAKIDPLGLAFDNYDAIGRWRTEEIVPKGTGANPPVDASGKLPDGRTFAGAADFKRLLADREDEFARALTEKLATYALRRRLAFDDEAQLKAIVKASRNDGYHLQKLVRNLIQSELFLKR
jgi:mono/diheme cytochrome c family protein